MNIQQFCEKCASLKAVTEHFPFDEDTLVFKVGGKMFAMTSLQDWENDKPSTNLKCDPEVADELRAQYDDIVPGYHMNKKHWNTIYINKGVSDKLIAKFIHDSYDLVFASLTKKAQSEISEMQN
ncbi:MAG: MmcQ/YjbR family DNA-binding protein [Flavobacterium sp.]|nr:MmcQ/YjbR family DNA-binding protein [Flavobacterium sp.]